MIFDIICYPLQHHVPKLNERAFVHTVEHRVSHRMETKIEHCTHHHHLFKLSFDRRSSGAELHIVRIDVNLYIRAEYCSSNEHVICHRFPSSLYTFLLCIYKLM